MDDETPKSKVIGRFGEKIAELHQRHVESIKRQLEKIDNPQTDYERAIAGYYANMDRDQFITSIASDAIESVLHDLFFLFDENDDFKIILEDEAGSAIDLAKSTDVIQAFPLTWITKRSAPGSESNRILDHLDKALNLRETRQERRRRILAKKSKPQPDDG